MQSIKRRKISLLLSSVTAGVLAIMFSMVPALAFAEGDSFLGRFNNVSQIASTVPSNGDQNPYGVAVVHRSIGKLVRGDILVSNFNNGSANGGQQGTGTTIMQVSPAGNVTTFSQIDATKLPGACPGGVGLTTALSVLSRGWVIVGSLPTTDGTSATAKAGCLLVLNSQGQVVETFSGGVINGPWDMTALDLGSQAVLFVTNVLNGTVANSPNTVNQGTVVRILLGVPEQGEGVPHRQQTTVIGTGFAERTDPAALVVGPTGVGLDYNGTLYVADSVNSRIAAIPNALFRFSSAGSGKTVSSGGALNDPLGLTIAPGGDILEANGNDGNIVEITPGGKQVATKLVDTTGGTGGGCLFGLTTDFNTQGVFFVDDCTNALNLLH